MSETPQSPEIRMVSDEELAAALGSAAGIFGGANEAIKSGKADTPDPSEVANYQLPSVAERVADIEVEALNTMSDDDIWNQINRKPSN